MGNSEVVFSSTAGMTIDSDHRLWWQEVTETGIKPNQFTNTFPSQQYHVHPHYPIHNTPALRSLLKLTTESTTIF